MKILVIGGMHGNEPLGLQVVKLFKNKPVEGVDSVLANEQAVLKNRRFIKTDLNRSFPGNIKSSEYESKRAAELKKLCKGYDVVLDFHNTHCPNNDCGFVGKSAKEMTFRIASFLNLKRIVIADYNCVNKYASNCLSVEISLTSKRRRPKAWYSKIVKLSKTKILPTASKLERYRFVYRISTEERDRFNIKRMRLRAFKAIPKELAKSLDIENPAYSIFIGDGFTPYNYGGLLNKLIV